MRPLLSRAASFIALLSMISCSASENTAGPAVGSVSITPIEHTLRVGETVSLAVVVRNASGEAVSGNGVVFTVSDPTVATVSNAGLLTALAPGTTTVAATISGRSATSIVNVLPSAVSLVQVTPASRSLFVGNRLALEARLFNNRGASLTDRRVTWSSSDNQIASVSSDGLVSALSPGADTITANSDGKSGSAVVTGARVPVSILTIAPQRDTIDVGATRQLSATATDSVGGLLVGRLVSWSTSNSAIATVSSAGLISAIAPGTVTVSALSEGITGVSNIVVRLRPVAAIAITPTSSTLPVGNFQQIIATVSDANGNVLNGRTVSWQSTNPSVATVTGAGVVAAIAPGNAVITATSEGRSANATVQVKPVAVAQVQLSPAGASVLVAGTIQLTATPLSSSGVALTGRTVTWTSASPSIASVNASGRITGVSPGIAAIRATIDGVTGTSTITVNAAPVASISISPSGATISPNGSVQLTAVLKDEAGNVLTGRSVEWSSSNESIAFVTSTGMTHGFRAGAVTITARSEGMSGTAIVVVR